MMFSARQAEIMALAKEQGRVLVDELAARFAVTPQTIRKDLNDLCDARALNRIHGGAVFPSGNENVKYEARRSMAATEKQAIGRAVFGDQHRQGLKCGLQRAQLMSNSLSKLEMARIFRTSELLLIRRTSDSSPPA